MVSVSQLQVAQLAKMLVVLGPQSPSVSHSDPLSRDPHLPVTTSADQCQHPDGAPCSTKIILELIIHFFHLFLLPFKRK